jgi:predicted metal-dependent phosphoesterase TrpH
VGRADLHIHTRVSDGLTSVEAVVEHLEQLGTLDVVAITDHEDATGGLRARELAERRGYRLQVIPGAEITTLQGHVVALFVERAPRSFRGIESTLEAIHGAGGVAIAPHPFSWLTRSISERTLRRLVGRAEPGITFDAVETHNPSPAGRITRRRVLACNEEWGIPMVGASDAHHLAHAGSGWTDFPGSTPEDLRRAILEGSTSPGMSRYASVREVGIGATMLGLAWGYTATPRKMLRLRNPAIGRAK